MYSSDCTQPLHAESAKNTYTVYLRSDATATIYVAVRFMRLLFEGGYYSREAESLETSKTDG